MIRTYGVKITGARTESDIEKITNNLSTLLKTSKNNSRKIIQEKSIIKKNTTIEKANKVKTAIEKTGVMCKVFSSYKKDDLSKYINETLREKLGEDINQADNLKKKQKKNCINYCAIPDEADILSIISNTMSNSLKRSIVICTSGIYWSKSFGVESSKHYVSWSDVYKAKSKIVGKTTKISISKDINIPLIGCSKIRKNLLPTLIEISETLHKEKIDEKIKPQTKPGLTKRDKLERKDKFIAALYFLPIAAIAIITNTPADTGPFSQEQVCRAGIATVVRKDPFIINTEKISGNIFYTFYRRPSDGSLWRNRCKLSGSKIIWGTRTGRWRTLKEDSPVFFSVHNHRARA